MSSPKRPATLNAANISPEQFVDMSGQGAGSVRRADGLGLATVAAFYIIFW